MNKENNLNILAIDTSSSSLKLGLSFGSDRLVKSEEIVEKSHGQLIIKKINELFQSAYLPKENLNTIVVSLGPGSFTGLRIGIAVAKGIAVALNIPVVGLNLFEIASFKLRSRKGKVSVIVPLKKDAYFMTEVFEGAYDEKRIRVVTDSYFSQDKIFPPLIGIGFDRAENFRSSNNKTVVEFINYDTSEMIYLGHQKLSSGMAEDLALIEPMYLQKSQAEINFELRNRK